MLYTEQHVRDNIRNREGKRVFYLGKEDQLTSGARDYLLRQRIEILPAQQAKVSQYKLLTGGFTTEKPEHMTHLDAQILVHKCHPRIAFRAAMDMLEAELLLCQQAAPEDLRKDLAEVLTFARSLIRCDVLNEPVEQLKLCGLDQQQLRNHSHRPQDFYGQPHFMPEYTDSTVLLQINRARCAARMAELKAVAAFSDQDGNPVRMDMLQAMNRMSSMLYILMIRAKKQEEGRPLWKQ